MAYTKAGGGPMSDDEERKSQAPTSVPPAAPEEVVVGLPSPGELLGGQRIVRLRGLGGQGAVFEAIDPRHDRVVALKVALPDAGTEGLNRLEREIEVLATLDHPNIPPLFESGRDRGRPWFSMRLVDGPTLLEHAVSRAASPRECVQMLLKVCAAVAHAHGRGVIHRDLKSANIRIDPTGEPQVLDFGIAKAEGRPALTLTAGAIGTVGDSAPEQLQGDARRVDVRADIYALGGLLYCLIAGRPPLILPDGLGDAIAAVMSQQPLPPSAHSQRGSRDLDAICLKALAKDPDQRYDTVLDFARDLERWQDGAAVEARGPSRWYRAQATIRRHRVAFALVGVALAVLATFTSALVARTRQLADERDRAKLESDKARAVADAFTSMIDDADTSLGGSAEASAVDLLELMQRRARTQGELDPRVRATILTSVSRAFMAFGNPARAEYSASTALRMLDEAHEGAGPERGEVLLAAGYAKSFRVTASREDAERNVREGLALIEAARGPNSNGAMAARRVLAECLLTFGQTDEAMVHARAVVGFERARGALKELAEALLFQASVSLERDDAIGALALADEARALLEATLQTAHPSRSRPDAIRGRALLKLGRVDEALAALDRSLALSEKSSGIEHPATQQLIFDAARASAASGHHDEAIRRFEDLLEVQRMYRGSHHPHSMETMLLLSRELAIMGRQADAARMAAEAASVRQALDLSAPAIAAGATK